MSEGEFSGSHAYFAAHSKRQEQLPCFGLKEYKIFAHPSVSAATCRLSHTHQHKYHARCVHACKSTITRNTCPLCFFVVFFFQKRLPDLNTGGLLFLQTPAPTSSTRLLSLLSEAFRLLDGKHQLLLQLLVAFVRWQVQSVEAGKLN